jgi:hypothetical protein
MLLRSQSTDRFFRYTWMHVIQDLLEPSPMSTLLAPTSSKTIFKLRNSNFRLTIQPKVPASTKPAIGYLWRFRRFDTCAKFTTSPLQQPHTQHCSLPRSKAIFSIETGAVDSLVFDQSSWLVVAILLLGSLAAMSCLWLLIRRCPSRDPHMTTIQKVTPCSLIDLASGRS